jgi:hypothetical protein
VAVAVFDRLEWPLNMGENRLTAFKYRFTTAAELRQLFELFVNTKNSL